MPPELGQDQGSSLADNMGWIVFAGVLLVWFAVSNLIGGWPHWVIGIGAAVGLSLFGKRLQRRLRE
ncbi:hypothetical protein [Streptomyces sp. NPDC050738]|uniref:hypothetical protein n=1 Tax=Streptomyces sp. NPDC050738 TaxID=3154744 RepID=UPI0034304557